MGGAHTETGVKQHCLSDAKGSVTNENGGQPTDECTATRKHRRPSPTGEGQGEVERTYSHN